MKEFLTFKNKEFGAMRTMKNERGEPLFCAKDVADALGYKNSRDAIAKHVEKEDKTTVVIRDTGSNYKSQAIFINESGLYALILSSKMEKAKLFKHWVTSEVLPSIRKQGGYMIANPNESDEVIMARALQIMQATLARRDEQIALLKPKADYSDEVLESVSCLTVTQIAKELKMTGHELNRLLCEKGIQYVQSGQYLLYAKYCRQGLAKNRTFMYHNASGEECTRQYLVWTEAGRNFIHQLFNQLKH